jgi:hypothetical protein
MSNDKAQIPNECQNSNTEFQNQNILGIDLWIEFDI